MRLCHRSALSNPRLRVRMYVVVARSAIELQVPQLCVILWIIKRLQYVMHGQVVCLHLFSAPLAPASPLGDEGRLELAAPHDYALLLRIFPALSRSQPVVCKV